MARLFVTDLDGTLLSSNIALSGYSAGKIKELIQSGVNITYSTSRSFYTASMLLKDAGFKLPCITFNGVYVIMSETGEVVKKNLLSREIYDAVLGIGREMGLRPYIFGKDSKGEEKLLYQHPDSEAQSRYIAERRKRNDKRLTADDGSCKLTELININYLYPLDLTQRLKSKIEKECPRDISIKVIRDIYNEGYFSLEVSNKDANKGKMLEYTADLLKIPLEDVTVFGDQANDIEMFEKAGTRVAVENAADELKAKADFITECNDRDGVVKYILKTLF